MFQVAVAVAFDAFTGMLERYGVDKVTRMDEKKGDVICWLV